MLRACRLLLACGLALAGRAADESAAELISGLLAAAKVPPAVRGNLDLPATDADDRLRRATAVQGGVRYALALAPIAGRDDPDLHRAHAERARGEAMNGALHALVGSAMRERYAKAGYAFDIALARALAESGRADWLAAGRLGPGMQEQRDEDRSHAAALVWLDADGITLLESRMPTAADLEPHYLRALHAVVRNDIEAKRFEAALEKLLAMRSHRHYPVAAELDTARCFAGLGKDADAGKLAKHVWTERQTELDTHGAESCADLLQAAGEHALAEEAYRKAIELAVGSR